MPVPDHPSPTVVRRDGPGRIQREPEQGPVQKAPLPGDRPRGRETQSEVLSGSSQVDADTPTAIPEDITLTPVFEREHSLNLGRRHVRE